MKIKFKFVANKMIAILCAFVMTFGAVTAAESPGSGAEDLSGKELYAIELLNIIGIYDGVDSITGKEAFVRRDVMAFLAARIIGISNDVYQGDAVFSDVDKDNFAYNAINTLAQMNIIKGNGNGKFEPFRDITLDEATEIILRVMGYSKLLDMQGSKMCTSLAQKHRLHKGIEGSKDKRLQVKQLSNLLYNALISDLPQIGTLSGNGSIEYKIENGKNLLSETYDIYKVEGIISANAYTSVDVVTGGNNGTVKIGNKIYKTGDTQAGKYIGYYVSAYYREGDVNTLLCIDVESNNNVVEFDIADAEYNNFRYTVYVNEKEETYDVSQGLNLIYNGKVIFYDEAKMKPTYGTITLINTDENDDFETVIVKDVRNVAVASYGAASNVIQDKYSKNMIELDKYSEAMCSVHKADGKPYKLTALKEWDVLSIMESDDTDYNKRLLDITVSTESVSGTVERTSDLNDTEILTIDGIEYEVAKTFFQNTNHYDIEVGYSGTFYFDMFGRIAAADGKLEQIKWGYLIKARKGSNEMAGTCEVKMLTQDANEVKKFETAEKLYVNNSEFNSDITTLENQVVRYSLDKKGKIKKIYTENTGFVHYATGDPINGSGLVKNVFVSETGMEIAMDSDTVIFQIPNHAANDDPYDEDLYGVKTPGSMNTGAWYMYVKAYGLTADDVTASLVVYERPYSNATAPSGTYMIISEIVASVDKDGYPAEKITGYDINKKKVEVMTRGSGVADSFKIEKGDFVVLVLYPDGTLQKAVRVFDCDRDETHYDFRDGYNINYNARKYNSGFFARAGYAYNRSSGFLLLSDDKTVISNRRTLNASSAAVFIVDINARKEVVKIGSLSDVNTFIQSGAADRIVCYGSNSETKVIVCYK